MCPTRRSGKLDAKLVADKIVYERGHIVKMYFRKAFGLVGRFGIEPNYGRLQGPAITILALYPLGPWLSGKQLMTYPLLLRIRTDKELRRSHD